MHPRAQGAAGTQCHLFTIVRKVPFYVLWFGTETLTMGLKVTSTSQDIPADMGPGG